jgi:hypothetical protein
VAHLGSWLGLAAIPGIAVFSLFAFSQARELKRLKIWAGRAPERLRERR